MAHLKHMTRDRLPSPAIEISDQSGCQQLEGAQIKKCEIAVKAGLTVIAEV